MNFPKVFAAFAFFFALLACSASEPADAQIISVTPMVPPNIPITPPPPIPAKQALAESEYQRGRDALAANKRGVAINLFEKSCKRGNPKSCFNVGLLREEQLRPATERSVSSLDNGADEVSGITTAYSDACALGFQRGCAMLVQYYRSRRYAMQNLPKAISLAQTACEANEVSACEGLAEMHYLGEGMPVDLLRAAVLFKKACDAGGRSLSCFNYALMNEKAQGIFQNSLRALEYYRIACWRGSDAACINLATIYTYDKDDVPGREISTGLLARSCENGAILACTNLAVLTQDYDATPAGNRKAAGLYRMACEAGDGGACRGLGNLMQDGIKEAGSKSEAIKYFVKGCELGAGDSCYNTGLMYLIGFRVPKRPLTGLSWFGKGCAMGSAASCSGAALASVGLKRGVPNGGEEAARKWLDYARYLDPDAGLVKSLKVWLDAGAKASDAPALSDRVGSDLPGLKP